MFKYAEYIVFVLLFAWWGFLSLSIVSKAREVKSDIQKEAYGWAYYQDGQYTPETPFIILPENRVPLHIDAAKTNELHLPKGSGRLYDPNSMTLMPDEPGSFFIARFDMLMASTADPFEVIFRLEVPGGRVILASELTVPGDELNEFRMTSVTFPFYATKKMVELGVVPTIESRSPLKVAGVGVLISKMY